MQRHMLIHTGEKIPTV